MVYIIYLIYTYVNLAYETKIRGKYFPLSLKQKKAVQISFR